MPYSPLALPLVLAATSQGASHAVRSDPAPQPPLAVCGSVEPGWIGPTITPGVQRGVVCPNCVIQLHLVVDHALAVRLGAGIESYLAMLIEGMNDTWSMSPAQGAPGIGVTLAGATVFSVADPWAPTTDPNALLSALRVYGQANLPVDGVGRDAVLLLTDADLDGSTIGVAFVGTLCGPNAFGLAQASGLPDADLVASMNHQLGHLAGCSHDGSGNACAASGFIMAPVTQIGSPAQQFSVCSIAYVDAFVSSGNIRALLAPPCPADLAAPFGTLNIFDIQQYLALYNTQDPAADIAAPFGSFNIFDIQQYLSLYNQGCP